MLACICWIVPSVANDACSELLREHAGREPVIAVAVGDENVGEVPTLGEGPIAEDASLVHGHSGIGEHRISSAVDECAGEG